MKTQPIHPPSHSNKILSKLTQKSAKIVPGESSQPKKKKIDKILESITRLIDFF
jgi:hypothetical protein